MPSPAWRSSSAACSSDSGCESRHRLAGFRITEMGSDVEILVIGCGNLLRGDDAAGPVLVSRMVDRGLPEGVRCVDCGTGGIDAALAMRGVPEVVLVDACASGSEPGTLFELSGSDLEGLPPPKGVSLHSVRFDHAIALGRSMLEDEYPARVTACLIEGETFEIGSGLSPTVDRAIDRLVDLLFSRFAARRKVADSGDSSSIPRQRGGG